MRHEPNEAHDASRRPLPIPLLAAPARLYRSKSAVVDR